MVLWSIFKENYILLSFLTLIIFICVFLLVAALKSRSQMSLGLLIAIMIVCALLILGALFIIRSQEHP